MLAQIKLVAWFNRPKQQRQPPQVIVPVIGRKEKFGVPSPDCLSGPKQSLEFRAFYVELYIGSPFPSDNTVYGTNLGFVT
jgi:hypothetical protein